MTYGQAGGREATVLAGAERSTNTLHGVRMPVFDILSAGPYNVAFAAAAAVGLLLARRAGDRAGFSVYAWTVLLAGALTGAILGSKLLFLDFQPIAPGEKTNLGGILGGIASVLVISRLLGLGARRSLDTLTVPTLAALAIGRVGCFLAHCCTGTATALPWGVTDGDGHRIHPVQLYEAVADLALISILRRRGAGMAPGVRITTGALGYAAVRFCTEFVRDGRTSYVGLNLVQWSLLAIIIVVLGVSASGVMSPRTDRATERPSSRVNRVGLVMLLAMIVTVLVGRHWLVPLEQVVILLLAGFVGAAAAQQAFHAHFPLANARLRLVGLAPRLGAVLLLQAPVPQEPKREVLIGGAFRMGTYEQLLSLQTGSSCNGGTIYYPTVAERESRVTLGSAGIRHRFSNGDQLTLEGQVLSGSDLVTLVNEGVPSEAPVERVRLSARGGAITFESDTVNLRVAVLTGMLSREGIATQGSAFSVNAQLRAAQNYFVEANYSGREWYASLGDFSYLGVGYRRSRRGVTAMIGVGQGWVGGITVPIGRVEADVRYREAFDRKIGIAPGTGFSVGVRAAIPLP